MNLDLNKMPDNILIKLAMNDWDSLELICWAFTLDNQLTFEYSNHKQLLS
jgi:hypothetical protein